MIPVKSFVHHVAKTVNDNSPTILSAIAVAGVVTTAVMAVKATPKAIKIVEAERAFRGRVVKPDSVEVVHVDMPFVDIAKLTWQLYAPAAIMGAATITCIIGSNSIGNRRNAAMISAYTLSETAREEYRNKVVETFGTQKEQEVRDEIAQDRVKAHPPANNEVIITDGGQMLCQDGLTGRYFKSDIETIRQAAVAINAHMVYEQYASLNDFYDKIGLEHTPIGDEIGWRVEKLLELKFSSTLAKNNQPALVIEFSVQPIRDYWRGNL